MATSRSRDIPSGTVGGRIAWAKTPCSRAAALELLREQPRRVEKLQRNAAVLRESLTAQGLPVPASSTQILPVIVGDAGEAVRASERALERGVFAQAIRPPTVPTGSSRLRLTVMASHTRSELRDAAHLLAKCVSVRAQPLPDLQVFDGLRDAA